MGGLGKTTLVKEVYQSHDLSGLFEKRACITIMRPFVLKEVIKSLAMQLDDKESSNGKGNIEELGKLLEGKRCMIVLDDLSSVEEWNQIRPRLSKMGKTSRIIVTTRGENIAKHCSQKPENIHKLKVLEYTDAFDLFTKKVFKEATNLDTYPGLIEEAEPILKKCNGLPLAIVTIGGFLAKQTKTPMVWRKLNEHLSAELEMNPELGIIRTILMKSYDGLPYHLKSCFLYLSIFPEDYNIDRRRLVHRWNAEGYSREARGKSVQEVANSYFMELIDQSMILPVRESIRCRKGIFSFKLHDLMREISISKAMEENLVFRMEEVCSINHHGTVRHLSINNNWEGDQSEFESIVDLSRIRSLTVFGKWKPFYISDKMRLLRVLDLESTLDLVDHHLEPIGKLLHLKYLSLRRCHNIFHLPESIGNLRQLQTLDIAYTRIIRVPHAIIKLRNLQCIRAGQYCRIRDAISNNDEQGSIMEGLPQVRNKLCMWTIILMACCLFSSCSLDFGRRGITDEEDYNNLNRRDVCTFFCRFVFPSIGRLADRGSVAVPKGLRKLKALHTLGIVNIAQGNTILQDIRRLTRLHKLAVAGINRKNCKEFCSTLDHLSCLESLAVYSGGEAGLRGCLDGLLSPPKKLQTLKLLGNLVKLPEWVASLYNLVRLKLDMTELTEVDGSMQVLGKLPNLAILHLSENTFQTEDPYRLTCHREALFPSLMVLELGYNDPGIRSVDFEEGTVPKIELLRSRAKVCFSGLLSLPNLKEVLIEKYFYSTELVEDLRAQLNRNPNKPVLKYIDF